MKIDNQLSYFTRYLRNDHLLRLVETFWTTHAPLINDGASLRRLLEQHSVHSLPQREEQASGGRDLVSYAVVLKTVAALIQTPLQD